MISQFFDSCILVSYLIELLRFIGKFHNEEHQIIDLTIFSFLSSYSPIKACNFSAQTPDFLNICNILRTFNFQFNFLNRSDKFLKIMNSLNYFLFIRLLKFLESKPEIVFWIRCFSFASFYQNQGFYLIFIIQHFAQFWFKLKDELLKYFYFKQEFIERPFITYFKSKSAILFFY